MDKLNYHTTPGGAMVCTENVNQKEGSADGYYEYCTTTEFLNPMGIILSNTGDFAIADRMEKMVFNALQGARLPDLKALSYLTVENRLGMSAEDHGGRETYDAYHKAAACCVLNGGRVMPYYIEHMWKKDASGKELIAILYGPNELNTTIAGSKIKINKGTNYPFSNEINFNIELDKPTNFDLVLRKPHHAVNVKINGVGDKDVKEFDDHISI
jgi:DUF1680 family protein